MERAPKVWNMRDKNCPKDTIYVGRPSKWGNPWSIGGTYNGKILNRRDVIRLYTDFILTTNLLNVKELKGKDLVCWCAPQPCHADILLKLANRD